MTRSRSSLGLLAVAMFTTAGCSQYDKVGPQAYEYSKALYSVCNRHDEPRLGRVASQIEQAAAGAELSGTEAAWLNDIVATAQAGDWQVASKDARRLMQAQVEGL